MAKSKEQKQKEAFERGRLAYLRDDLYLFCGDMPGGSTWIPGEDPEIQLEGMLIQCKMLMDKVKELKLDNLIASKSTWTSMVDWDPIHLFAFLVGRKENMLTLIQRMHEAHCEAIPEGDPCRRDLYGNGIVREAELSKFVEWLKVYRPKFFTGYTWMTYDEMVKPTHTAVR